MRVAVITRRFFRAGGGAEGYAVALVREMATRHEVHVFSQQTDEPVPGVTYHPLRFWGERPRWINQWVFACSSWWHTRRGFDVVHSHENTWHGHVQTIHVRPLRFNLFHGLTGWRLVLRWLKIAWSPRLLTYLFLEGARFKPREGRTVVAASGLLRDDCLMTYPKTQVSVIPPGVDWPRHTRSREQARAVLGVSVAYPLLLFVANDYARKGLDTVLQAMTTLDAQTHLAVVGSKKQMPAFLNRVKALGLLDRVHFVGSLDDVTVAYQAADVLVHPTLEDSYAMVVPEAMANGLPVIVSAYPWCGVASELKHGVHAMLLDDPQAVSVLARIIHQILANDDLRASLIGAGQAFIQSHDWQSASLKYERIYEHMRVHS